MEILSVVIPTIVIPICILYVLINVKWEKIVSILFNGAIILLGIFCEVRALYHLKDDWTISVIIAGMSFIALTIMCTLDYLDVKKEAMAIDISLIEKMLQEEDKFILSVIEDFKKGHYYLAEVNSKRVHLKVDNEDGIWKLTYINYLTGEKCEYNENQYKNNNKNRDKE
jgi:hypothetical protein